MSWQRILELAREQGMPVIVTDLDGRDSMVVMPLERFEQLTHHSKMNAGDRPVRIEINGSVTEKPRMEELPTIHQTLSEINESVGTNEISELSLEEKFYLEPLDENQD